MIDYQNQPTNLISDTKSNSMGLDVAISKLESSNAELKNTLEQLDEQFKDLRNDPRFERIIDDLQELALNYLKTWIKMNTQVIEMINPKS